MTSRDYRQGLNFPSRRTVQFLAGAYQTDYHRESAFLSWLNATIPTANELSGCSLHSTPADVLTSLFLVANESNGYGINLTLPDTLTHLFQMGALSGKNEREKCL